MSHVRGQAGRRPDSSVYFVSAPTVGLVKIGVTTDVLSRFLGLTKMSPVPLRLLLSVPGTAHQEASMHRRFAWAHSHGEWFALNEVVQQFINQLCIADERQRRKLLGPATDGRTSVANIAPPLIQQPLFRTRAPHGRKRAA